jgi:hypothetical protein
MKARKLIYKMVFAVLMALAISLKLNAQSAVYVQSLVNFPDLPSDTAYEGQSYNFDVVVFNGTNSVVTGNLFIYMDVDSVLITLGSPALQVNINPGDTLIVPVTGFNFTQPQFKIGNNIVVVWPVVASGIFYPIDSLYTEVFFVPLNSTGLPHSNSPETGIYPNPVKDRLFWSAPNGKAPERVRIFDTRGSVVRDLTKPEEIQVSDLPVGLYFIELYWDDYILREKFFKW